MWLACELFSMIVNMIVTQDVYYFITSRIFPDRLSQLHEIFKRDDESQLISWKRFPVRGHLSELISSKITASPHRAYFPSQDTSEGRVCIRW